MFVKEKEHYIFYKKVGDRVFQLKKGGFWEDITEEYNNRVEVKENDYTKKENKLLWKLWKILTVIYTIR